MTNSTQDLGSLFGQALQALTANKDQINQLDGYNGNHGDNVVSTLNLITQGLQNNSSRPPAEALQQAASLVQQRGQGGSSRYYAQGLRQAAAQVQGQENVSDGDVMSVVQSILGAVPAQGASTQTTPGGSVMDLLTGLAGNQAAPGSSSANNPPGLDLNDLMNAGMAYVQATQAGADSKTALTQAAMSGLLGVNPMQTGTPRAAAGSMIAQTIMQALLNRR